MKYFTRYVRTTRYDESDYTHEHDTLEQAIMDVAAEVRWETFDTIQVLVEAPEATAIIAAGQARTKELEQASTRRDEDQRLSKKIADRLFYLDLMNPR